MSLPRRILLVPAIGAALLIAGCSSNHLTAGQSGVVGTEVVTNVVRTFDTANGNIGVEPTPTPGATTPGGTKAAPTICTDAGVCTIPTPTTFSCPFSSTVGTLGNVSLQGTFDEALTTTTATGIETEAITDSAFTVSFANPPATPLGCSFDDEVILTGGSVAVAQTGSINLDLTNNNVELPYTIIVNGTVDYTKGPDALPTFPAGSGSCTLANVTITYSLASPATCTTGTFCSVNAFVASGTVCGHTIPAAGETITGAASIENE